MSFTELGHDDQEPKASPPHGMLGCQEVRNQLTLDVVHCPQTAHRRYVEAELSQRSAPLLLPGSQGIAE